MLSLTGVLNFSNRSGSRHLGQCLSSKMRFRKGTLEIMGPKTGPPESTMWVDVQRFCSKIKDFGGFRDFGFEAQIS